MIFMGIIWTTLAPLLFFIAIFFILKKFHLTIRKRLFACALIMIIPTVFIWIPEKLYFEDLCSKRGTPVIHNTVFIDGFFLDDSTANSFGRRYLQNDGFSWVEAKSIYHPKKFTLYKKIENSYQDQEVESIQAEYMVKSIHQYINGTHINEHIISNLKTGDILAKASSLHFSGGKLKWLLGFWGSATCPSARTDHKNFETMYNLVKLTLRDQNKDTNHR